MEARGKERIGHTTYLYHSRSGLYRLILPGRRGDSELAQALRLFNCPFFRLLRRVEENVDRGYILRYLKGDTAAHAVTSGQVGGIEGWFNYWRRML
jgi:hypothetical protein